MWAKIYYSLMIFMIMARRHGLFLIIKEVKL